MPTSYRVRGDAFSAESEWIDLGGKRQSAVVVDKVGKQWRIYEAWGDYSATSGGFIVKGKVVRRYDPDAGDREGKPAAFASKALAVAYIDKWMRPAIEKEKG